MVLLGLMYSFMTQIGGMYGGNILMAMYSTFIVIGIISVCIGLPLLIVGLVRRSQYNSPYRKSYSGRSVI